MHKKKLLRKIFPRVLPYLSFPFELSDFLKGRRRRTKDPAEQKIEKSIRTWVFKKKLHNIFYKEGRFLHDFIVEHRLKNGLEIGTADGYSSLWIARAMRKTGGKLTTIEIDEETWKEAAENFRKADVQDIIEAKCADAFDVLPQMEENFDFIFLDAEKKDYAKLFLLVFPKLLPGGVFVAHNTVDFKKELSEFIALVKSYPELDTEFYEKEQGFSISYRKKTN